MKKCIKTNLYAAVDVMAVITVLLLFVAIANKSEKIGKAFGIMGAVSFITMVTQMFIGKSKIENDCPQIIYTKSEEGCDSTELEPGLERYDIDGVKCYGVTYKLVDGVHGVMKRNGTLKIKSFTGKIVNWAFGGGVVPYSPDSCWDALIKAPYTDYLRVQ